MPRTTVNKPDNKQKSDNTGSSPSASNRSNTRTTKKQTPVNIKVPLARDRARDFDESRRNDAYSNEL
jgi:hypothetical protein